jgi:hypothetical protein
MEAATPYANSRTGLYWIGNRLMFYSLEVARITHRDPFWGRSYWHLKLSLPISPDCLNSNLTGLDEIKADVENYCRDVIDIIKRYD